MKPITQITIDVGTTWIEFTSDKHGNLTEDGDVNIRSYTRSKLTEYEWDRNGTRKLVHTYALFDADRNRARLPRNCLDSLVEYLHQYDCEVVTTEVAPVIPKAITVEMKPEFTPRDNQQLMIDFLSDEDHGFKTLSAQTGSGKCGRVDDHVLTTEGWRRYKDLRVGDTIMTEYGEVSTITGIFPRGVVPVMKLVFNDDRSITTGLDHLWSCTVDDLPERVVLTTKQIGILLDKGHRVMIPTIKMTKLIEVLCFDLSYFDKSTIQEYQSELTSAWIRDEATFMKNVTVILPEMKALLVAANIFAKTLVAMTVLDHMSYIWERHNGYDYLNCMFTKYEWAKFFTMLIHRVGGVAICQPFDVLSHGRINGPSYQVLFNFGTGIEGLETLTVFDTYVDYILQELHVALSVSLLEDVGGAPRLAPLEVVMAGDACTYRYPCIYIMVDNPTELYITDDYIVTHNTFVAISTISRLMYPTIIVLGSLIDQWFKCLLQYTDISKDEIYVVKGYDSLKELWNFARQGYSPKVILFSTRTLALYALERDETSPYAHLPSYEELQEVLGLGVMIHDETHMNFYTNTCIDLKTNIKHNLYLSATYDRSNPCGRRIFDLVFPPELRFGEQFVKKYTEAYIVHYKLGLSDKYKYKMRTFRGYAHSAYENTLVKTKYLKVFVDVVLVPSLDTYFVTKRTSGQKCLILCQTRTFVLELVAIITPLLKGLKISAYFSGDPRYGDDDRMESDIIISTIKSCSTGVDIKSLKTCINTVSFSSAPQAAQVFGRLRQIPDEITIFVDLCNDEIDAHTRHIHGRKNSYRNKALSIHETRLS